MYPKLKPDDMVIFLEEAAKYFANRPTGGEDRAYWSNVFNSEKCKDIAKYIKGTINDLGR